MQTDDDVILYNAPVAAAGDDQYHCNNGTTFTLAGNAATPRTGTWTIVSGTGTITSPNSETSTVTGATCRKHVRIKMDDRERPLPDG